MSERYVIKDRWIFDTKLNKNIHSIDCYEEKSVLDIMNGQDQRIAELEEQLKKFTEPKRVKFNKFNGCRGTRFKCPNCNKQIENCIDYTADYYCKSCGQRVVYPKFRVVNNIGELYFEEAQAKLKELGESDVKD